MNAKTIRLWQAGARCAFVFAFAFPSSAQQLQRYPISPEMVVDALRTNGVSADAARIHMPLHITTAVAAPELKVTHATTMADGTMRLQVRCARMGECVSFLVWLEPVHATQTDLSPYARAGLATVSGQFAGPQPGLVPASGTAVSSEPLIRVGQHLVLWMTDSHLQIHVPAVALDSGERGQLIRVTTANGSADFSAIVVDSGNVKGEGN